MTTAKGTVTRISVDKEVHANTYRVLIEVQTVHPEGWLDLSMRDCLFSPADQAATFVDYGPGSAPHDAIALFRERLRKAHP